MRSFDESASAGGLTMFVFGLFIIGFFYIIFSKLVSYYVDFHNLMVSDNTIPISQSHVSSIDGMFAYWWAIPIIAIIVFIIYSIKAAQSSQTGEAY